MRRHDSLSPIVHQSLTRSQIPCVRECVCNNCVFGREFSRRKYFRTQNLVKEKRKEAKGKHSVLTAPLARRATSR